MSLSASNKIQCRIPGLLAGIVIIIAGLVSLPVLAKDYLSCDEQSGDWRDVSGKWVASVGPLLLKTEGNKVSGIYNGGLWALSLEYSRDRKNLSGRWDHLDGRLAGPVIFFLDASGCIKHAKWGGTGVAVCTPQDYSACTNNWAIHGRARPGG